MRGTVQGKDSARSSSSCAGDAVLDGEGGESSWGGAASREAGSSGRVKTCFRCILMAEV
jgi:hypothetical protein